MPQVSIIMGVHNGARTLERSVDSILNQTYNDFEFIICDDNSNDSTLSILRDYAEKDSRVIVLHNEKNLGLAASLNRCIDISKGEYIGRMDDDDVSHPNRFEKQIQFAGEHPEYAIVGTKRRLFDSNGVWGEYKVSGELTARDIYTGKVFSHPTVIINKEALLKCGCYTVSKRTMRGQDFDLWCKMYSQGYRGCVMDEVLFDYYEDRNKVKTFTWKRCWYSFCTRLKWRRKLGLSLFYVLFAFKPLIAVLIPKSIMARYKKRNFS